MMSLWDALRMNMMISYQELVRTFHSFAIKLVMKTELRRTIHADNKTTIGIQRSDQRLIIAMPVSTTTAPAIRRAR